MQRFRLLLVVGYALLAAGVLVATLVFPAFRAISYAPARELFVPPPEPVVVTMVYSTEKQAWLEETIADFERTRPMVDGHPVELELLKSGSREMYLDVLEGKIQPDLMSPASSLQIAILEELSKSRYGQPIVRQSACQVAVQTPLVLVAWKDRATALWGTNPNGSMWKRLHDVLVDPSGWATYGHPEWGFVKYGQTDPLKSNSGFMAIVLMTYNYFDKTTGLTNDDLTDPDYQTWFVEFQNAAVRPFAVSTGPLMRDTVAFGPSQYNIVAVYEATAIENLENAVNRYGELYVYYPPATVMSDHPFCVLEAAWVEPQRARAAALFVDYLRSRSAQEAALRYGFRPVDLAVPLDGSSSPFTQYQNNGLQRDLPLQVDLPAGSVLDALLDLWSRQVRQ